MLDYKYILEALLKMIKRFENKTNNFIIGKTYTEKAKNLIRKLSKKNLMIVKLIQKQLKI